jgi:hypothetical protein
MGLKKSSPVVTPEQVFRTSGLMLESNLVQGLFYASEDEDAPNAQITGSTEGAPRTGPRCLAVYRDCTAQNPDGTVATNPTGSHSPTCPSHLADIIAQHPAIPSHPPIASIKSHSDRIIMSESFFFYSTRPHLHPFDQVHSF